MHLGPTIGSFDPEAALGQGHSLVTQRNQSGAPFCPRPIRFPRSALARFVFREQSGTHPETVIPWR